MGEVRPLRAKFQTAIALLYPPRCIACGEGVSEDFALCGPCRGGMVLIGEACCDGCGVPLPGATGAPGDLCEQCFDTPRDWTRGRAAMLYEGTGRDLVLKLKHGGRQEIARPAARWMAQAVKPILVPDMVVVPVPLHRWRLFKRTYNQSALLANALARYLSLPSAPGLLVRHRATPMLGGLTRDERRALLRGAIGTDPRQSGAAAGRTVLLVDDVITTGATLNACASAAICAGAREVRVLTLARAAKDT